jgi:hypothetical protein
MNLNIFDQIRDPRFKGTGDPSQCCQGNVFFAAFHSPHIIRMKVRPFCQFLLAQIEALPLFTDGYAQDDTVIGTRTHQPTQLESGPLFYTAKRMILWLHCR